ncbi:hypothetical protein ACFFX0_21570 [Citricoccus parietis]|uniref:Uncharacterized protein n=1 Tax=Citricoccus parietis TaxID=592307 RepID=A0ABV5G3Y7_9MICC
MRSGSRAVCRAVQGASGANHCGSRKGRTVLARPVADSRPNPSDPGAPMPNRATEPTSSPSGSRRTEPANGGVRRTSAPRRENQANTVDRSWGTRERRSKTGMGQLFHTFRTARCAVRPRELSFFVPGDA